MESVNIMEVIHNYKKRTPLQHKAVRGRIYGSVRCMLSSAISKARAIHFAALHFPPPPPRCLNSAGRDHVIA